MNPFRLFSAMIIQISFIPVNYVLITEGKATHTRRVGPGVPLPKVAVNGA
jgi:hypothetical protein